MTWIWVDADPERIAQALGALGAAISSPEDTPPSPPPARFGPTPLQVEEAVGRVFDVTISEMQSRHRTPRISLARQVAMYLLREMAEMRLTDIAGLFGKKDHSTVIYAVEKIARKLKTERAFRDQVHRVREDLSITVLKICGKPGDNVLIPDSFPMPPEDFNIINMLLHTPDGRQHAGRTGG